MTIWTAWIRGINVGATRKIPMAALRDACARRGLMHARTHIQSGNLVLASAAGEAEVRALVVAAVAEVGGFDVPVAVLTGDALVAAIGAIPWADALARPTAVHLAFPDGEIGPTGRERLAAWPGPERIAVGERVAYVDYVHGVGRSKLAPAWLDRAAGVPVTARNLNTVLAVAAMVRAGDGPVDRAGG